MWAATGGEAAVRIALAFSADAAVPVAAATAAGEIAVAVVTTVAEADAIKCCRHTPCAVTASSSLLRADDQAEVSC